MRTHAFEQLLLGNTMDMHMKTWDTLLWQCEDLAALQAHLLSADEPWVRAQLLQQFAALKTYRNAEEWNRLVRVCEGLRMVGKNKSGVCSKACKFWRSSQTAWAAWPSCTPNAIPCPNRRYAGSIQAITTANCNL